MHLQHINRYLMEFKYITDSMHVIMSQIILFLVFTYVTKGKNA